MVGSIWEYATPLVKTYCSFTIIKKVDRKAYQIPLRIFQAAIHKVPTQVRGDGFQTKSVNLLFWWRHYSVKMRKRWEGNQIFGLFKRTYFMDGSQVFYRKMKDFFSISSKTFRAGHYSPISVIFLTSSNLISVTVHH